MVAGRGRHARHSRGGSEQFEEFGLAEIDTEADAWAQGSGLHAQLNDAVKREDYEQAARLKKQLDDCWDTLIETLS